MRWIINVNRLNKSHKNWDLPISSSNHSLTVEVFFKKLNAQKAPAQKKKILFYLQKNIKNHAVMLTHSEGLMKKKLQRQYGKSKRRTRKAR